MSLKEIFENERFGEPKIICDDCQHFWVGSIIPRCTAFEERIPDEILFKGYDHTKSFKGDNGILYKKLI